MSNYAARLDGVRRNGGITPHVFRMCTRWCLKRQLHAMTTLLPKKEVLIAKAKDAEWASEQILVLW